MHSDCRAIFEEKFQQLNNEKYYWTAKDAGALVGVLKQIRFFMPEEKRDDIAELTNNFRIFLDVIIRRADSFTLKKGGNTVDFTVTPYCRIVNEKISYDASAKKIVATFQVELGDGTKANSIDNVAFCANTQVFVGCKFFNLAKDDPGAKRAGGFDWATWSSKPACQPGETVTLEINLEEPKNAELFKYEQDRYVRIAAQAGGNNYNSQAYYNFSKIYRISADYKTIEPVVWED
jgi:hypothetical protein